MYLAKKTSIIEPGSLYERLGGHEVLTKIVEGMYYRIFNNPDSADFFRKTDKHMQIQRMVAFFTYSTGGADEWEGKSMKEVH